MTRNHDLPTYVYQNDGFLSNSSLEGFTVRFLFLFVLILAACQSATPTPEATPEPTSLITEAADNIRASQTFRMQVLSTGAPYPVYTDFGGNVFFRQATAQYVAPATMQGSVRLVVASIPADVDIFARGEEQWYRNTILTGSRWVQQPFAPGFNPQILIAEDTGFQAALDSLIDLQYVGQISLEDGTPVFHLKATADGADVSALLAGIIVVEGATEVEVFVDVEKRIPVRFIIRLPGTATTEEPEPTTWTVDVYDINAEPELDDPALESTVEPTAEVTADA